MVLAGKKLFATLLGVILVAGGGGIAVGRYALAEESTVSPERVFVTVTPEPTPTPSVNPKFSPAPGAQKESEKDLLIRLAKGVDAAQGTDPDKNSYSIAKNDGTYAVVSSHTAGSQAGGGSILFKKARGLWIFIWAGNGSISEDIMQQFKLPSGVLGS